MTEKISFTCGGTRFVLARDDAGRWGHNRRAEKALANLSGNGEIGNIRTVEALCELMTDGLIPPERAVDTAKGCHMLSAGRSCKTLWELDKSIMFLALAAQTGRDDLASGESSLVERYGYQIGGTFISESAKKRSSNYDHTKWQRIQAGAQWLRKAMSLCDEIEERASTEESALNMMTAGRLLVARAAANTETAWHSDPTLWSEYLKWALPKPEIRRAAVDSLDVALGKVAATSLFCGDVASVSGVLNGDDIPSAREHPATTLFSYFKEIHLSRPYWDLVPQARSEKELRGPDIGCMVAAAARRDVVLEALNGQRLDESPIDCYGDTSGFAKDAQDLWGENFTSHVFGYEAPVILWKAAFREITEASLAARCLSFGRSAHNLEECLLGSFDRTGHPAWTPLHSGLADLAANALVSVTRTWYPGQGDLAGMIHNDFSQLFKALEKIRFRP